MSIQMADSHLTYIGSGPNNPGGLHASAYDVYSRDGGPQLGWVIHKNGAWTAIACDRSHDHQTARRRWEAATAIWGNARDFPRERQDDN